MYFIPIICNNGKKTKIFFTCRELNNAKTALINGKIYNVLGVTNLNKTNNWECITGKSFWVNINFNETNQINNNSEHLSFSFATSSLNDLLNFSINLIDDNSKTIEFNTGETKISILFLHRRSLFNTSNFY